MNVCTMIVSQSSMLPLMCQSSPAPGTDMTSGVVREIVPVVTAHQSFYDDGVVVVRVLPLHCLLSV